MSKDEALKIAIELLEKDLLDIAIEMKDEVVSKSWSDLRMIKYYDQIIEYTKQTIQDCKEALEQPAQEPVDDGLDWKTKVYTILGCYRDKMPQMQVKAVQDFVEEIYTHPYQWQVLTDDEIVNLAVKMAISYKDDAEKMAIEFARAIEQALKEKNT